MARPRNANPKRTRQLLLAAATECFSTHGAQATSLRQVAAAAGVTMPTIHYYFGSKEALYQASMDAALGQLAQEISPLAQLFRELPQRAQKAESVDVGEVVELLIREAFHFARQHPQALRLIMRALLDNGELDPSWREGAFVPFLEEGTQFLAASLKLDPFQLRLGLQSLTALTMRYALSSPRELARLAGVPDDPPAALRVFEDHLVHVARRLLLDEVTP